MKRRLIVLELFCLLISNFNSVYACNSVELLTEDEYNIKNVEINDNVIKFEMSSEECQFDLDSDVIYIGDDTTVRLNTTVEIVDPEIKLSEEQLLEMEKDRIIQRFIELSNNGIELYSSDLNPQVPSNASWRVVANYSKNIASIQGEAETALNRLTLATGILSLLNKIPYKEYLQKFSTKLGLALTVAASLKVSATGLWKYQMHATNNVYPAGNTKQICYRYAHSALNMKITVLEGKYKTQIFNIDSKQTGIGGWWVSQKPY